MTFTRGSSARVFAAATAIGITILGLASPAAATASNSSVRSGLALSGLEFARSHVDARTGVVDTLTWTVTNSDPAATGFGGDLYVQRQNADGTFGSVPIDIPFSYMNSGYSWMGSWVSGTPQRSKFTFDFVVPQYSDSTAGTWVVNRVVLTDDAHTVDTSPDTFGDFNAKVTAKTLVDTGGPVVGYTTIVLNNSVYHPYVYVGPTGGEAAYAFDVQDGQSGIWKGELDMAGPTGQTVSAPFVLSTPNAYTSGYGCGGYGGGDINYQRCEVPVQFPAGSAPGVWRVTRIVAYDNAGNSTVTTDPTADTVTLTTDSTLTAGDFAITPAVLDDWTQDVDVVVTMSVAGAVDGVSAIYVDPTWESGCRQNDQTVTGNADGTYSVKLRAYRTTTRCGVRGLAVVDGAGNVALYGTEYGLADMGLMSQQQPDTPPTLTSVTLSADTVAAGDSFTATVQTHADVAPVTQVNVDLLDATGNSVASGYVSIYTPTDTSTVTVYVPGGLAPGTYDVKVLVSDAAFKYSYYGGPYGQPMPGGPLTVTVTG
jgi:hypothetical protein